MRRLLLALPMLLALWLPGPAQAHALDPGYLDLAALQDEGWRVAWRVPDVGGRPMPISARLPATCTGADPAPPVFDGRAWITGWIVTCPGGLAGGTIAIDGLERTATETLVRYELRPGESRMQRLTPSETDFVVPEEAGTLGIAASYVWLGVTHILGGVDHLLFVFALMLLIGLRGRLLWAITAFTIAHSLTLASASLGWLNVPPPPVEAVIALSIVFLAYELTLPPEARDALAERFPWIVAFAFGLIHGLGFAGALREIGLPEGDIPLALLSFNIGVELGQILFIALVAGIGLLALRLFPMLARAGETLTRATGYAIGTVAAFWVVERVAAF